MADAFKILFTGLSNISKLDFSKIDELNKSLSVTAGFSGKINSLSSSFSKLGQAKFDNLIKLQSDLSNIAKLANTTYKLNINIDSKSISGIQNSLSLISKKVADINNKVLQVNVGSTSDIDKAVDKTGRLSAALKVTKDLGAISIKIKSDDTSIGKTFDKLSAGLNKDFIIKPIIDSSGLDKLIQKTKQVSSVANISKAPVIGGSALASSPKVQGRADATADGIVAAGSLSTAKAASVDLVQRFNVIRDLSIDVVKTSSKNAEDLPNTFKALSNVLATTTLSITDYKFAAVEAAKANLQIGDSTGKPTEGFINFIKVLEQAAASTGKSAEELTPKLIKTATTLNKGFEGLSGAARVDALTESIKRSIAAANALEDRGGGGFKAADILNFAQRFGGAAASAGATEEKVAALAATAAQSRSGAEALATAWERVFIEIKNAGNGTDKSIAQFKALGFDARQLREAFSVDGFAATFDVLRQLGKLPLADQGKAIADLLGGGLDANQASIIAADLQAVEGRLATNLKIAQDTKRNREDLSKITLLEQGKASIQSEQAINNALIALQEFLGGFITGSLKIINQVSNLFKTISGLGSGFKEIAQVGLVAAFVLLTATVTALGRGLAAQFFTIGRNIAGSISGSLATIISPITNIFRKTTIDANTELNKIGIGAGAGLRQFETSAKLTSVNVSNALKSQYNQINSAAAGNSQTMRAEVEKWRISAIAAGTDVNRNLSKPINTNIIAGTGVASPAGSLVNKVAGVAGTASLVAGAVATTTDNASVNDIASKTSVVAGLIATISIALSSLGSVLKGSSIAVLVTRLVTVLIGLGSTIAAILGAPISVTLAAIAAAATALAIATGLIDGKKVASTIADAFGSLTSSMINGADYFENVARNSGSGVKRGFAILASELIRAVSKLSEGAEFILNGFKIKVAGLNSLAERQAASIRDNQSVNLSRNAAAISEAQKTAGRSNVSVQEIDKAKQSLADKLLKGNDSRTFDINKTDSATAQLVQSERARASEEGLKARTKEFEQRAKERASSNAKVTLNVSVNEKSLTAKVVKAGDPPLIIKSQSDTRKFDAIQPKSNKDNPFSFPIGVKGLGSIGNNGIPSIISPSGAPKVIEPKEKRVKEERVKAPKDQLIAIRALNEDQQSLINALETNISDITQDNQGLNANISAIAGLRSLSTISSDIDKLKDLYREKQISQQDFLETIKPLLNERQITSDKIREIISAGQSDANTQLDTLLSSAKTENDKIRIKNSRAVVSNEAANNRQKLTKATDELNKFVNDVANDISGGNLDKKLSDNSKALARDVAVIRRKNPEGNRTGIEDRRIAESIAALEIQADLNAIEIINKQIEATREQLKKNGLTNVQISNSPLLKGLEEQKTVVIESVKDKEAQVNLQRTRDSSFRKITDSISDSLSKFNPFAKDENGDRIGFKKAKDDLFQSIIETLQSTFAKDTADLFKTQFNDVFKSFFSGLKGDKGSGNLISDISNSIQSFFGFGNGNKSAILPSERTPSTSSGADAAVSVFDGIASTLSNLFSTSETKSSAIGSVADSLIKSPIDCCDKTVGAIKDLSQSSGFGLNSISPALNSVSDIATSISDSDAGAAALSDILSGGVSNLINSVASGNSQGVQAYIGAIQTGNDSFLNAFSLFGIDTTSTLASGITGSLDSGFSSFGSSLSGLFGGGGAGGGIGGALSGLLGGGGGWQGLLATGAVSLLGSLFSKSEPANKGSFGQSASGVFKNYGGDAGIRGVVINNNGAPLAIQKQFTEGDILNIVANNNQNNGIVSKTNIK
jgi:hypothetical protein